MRKLISLLMILSLFIMAGASQAGILYENDFSSGNLSGWTTTGTWSVSGGTLNNGPGPSGHDVFAFIPGIVTPDKFILEADVMVNDNIRGNDSGHVGLVWGFQNESLFTTTYIRTHYDQVTTWHAPYDGTEFWLAATMVNFEYYHLKVEVDYAAPSVKVWLNDAMAEFASVPMDPGGQIGLIGWGEITKIDNLRLTIPDCGSPVPEPSTLLLFGCGLLGLSRITRKRRK